VKQNHALPLDAENNPSDSATWQTAGIKTFQPLAYWFAPTVGAIEERWQTL
jgi:hypothetical protein